MQNTYQVAGMTCEHCARSVTEEVEEIAGVSNVVVDHATGSLTFDSSSDIDRSMVADAVEEAGYTLID